MAELRRSEPNQCDVQKKLSSVLLAALEEQRQRLQQQTATFVDSADNDDIIPTLPGTESGEGQTLQLRTAMEVVCKMCDQMLFMMVEWARGARFFRELKVRSKV